MLGNPSDGYEGKAISVIVRDYHATVYLEECEKIIFRHVSNVGSTFDSLNDVDDELDGQKEVDGGIRLLASATRRFVNFFKMNGISKFDTFSASFDSNIPREVGLAGSSAIVIAMLKALCLWHSVEIEPDVMASLALAAETDLGISAGLQDRVIQCFEGAMYMDFAPEVCVTLADLQIGKYQRVDPNIFQNLYISFASDLHESTEVLHSDLKSRYQSGDRIVVQTLNQIAKLAEVGRHAIENNETDQLAQLIDKNFDLRRAICKLNPEHIRMVETARSFGASAKYCGSGGAIIGLADESCFEELKSAMQSLGCHTFRPTTSE